MSPVKILVELSDNDDLSIRLRRELVKKSRPTTNKQVKDSRKPTNKQIQHNKELSKLQPVCYRDLARKPQLMLPRETQQNLTNQTNEPDQRT